MAKHYPYLIVVVVVVLALVVHPLTLAQSGVCPDYTTQINAPPPGTTPPSSPWCTQGDEGSTVSVEYNPEYPCGGALHISSNVLGLNDHPQTYVVPPVGAITSGQVRIGFMFWGENPLGGGWNGDIVIRIRTYNSTGNVAGVRDVTVTNHPSVVGDLGIKIYIVEEVMSMGDGGMVELVVTYPEYILMPDYYITSFKLIDAVHNLPPMCEVPGASLPTPTPTPTPTTIPPTNTPYPTTTTGPLTPTSTPLPTSTDTPTPSNTPTPPNYPTSAGGTFTPFPTPTIQAQSTISGAPGTPTAFPSVTIEVPSIPTVNIPTIPSIIFGGDLPNEAGNMATVDARLTQVAGTVATIQYGPTAFATITGWGDGQLDTGITSTTGISTAADIAGDIVESVSVPFNYLRFIRTYMPNIWPLVFFLLLGLAWVFFNLVAKFVVSNLSTIAEWIRRLIELIPFVE